MAETIQVQSDYGEQAAAMFEFCQAGEVRAAALDNRGPIRYNEDGTLHDEIVESYWEHGFYIFEGVVKAEELDDIEKDVEEIIDRAPLQPGGKVDRHGRPALAADA